MARRTQPPFRADHVGSLLRPQRLLDARDKKKRGEIDVVALRKIEDECIREAVKLQEDVGLQCATDGEFRRTFWHLDFLEQFTNVTVVPPSVKASPDPLASLLKSPTVTGCTAPCPRTAKSLPSCSST